MGLSYLHGVFGESDAADGAAGWVDAGDAGDHEVGFWLGWSTVIARALR